jgi:DNA-binding beta-propeller fold protein YncE
MPKTGPALTHDEVTKLKNWISSGAPDSKGKVMWSDNPNRKKYYVINQGCRVVTVFDAETNLPMRYVDVADASEQNTAPHQVRVAPDGQYWYVCMIGGAYIKKFRTSDDGYEGKIFVGNASWNTMAFTPDSKYLFTVDWSAGGSSGKVKKCDLNAMQVVDSTFLSDVPHGSCVSPDGKYVYITATAANYVYKIHVDSLSKPGSYQYIDFDGQGPTSSLLYNPHEITFTPDGTRYYVSCPGNNNVGDLSVKVFGAALDNLIASISLPSGPYEMSASASMNKLFVSSYDGTSQYPNGQVMVIDIPSNGFVKSIETGVQPHGIAVDDAAGLVYVANRNLSNNHPPHHTSVCGGVNGTIKYIDLATLEVLEKEVIVSRDPYFISIRF